MRKTQVSVIMAAADADAICLSQTPGGAGSLTINGALASGGVATLDIARHVEISSTGNDSGRTFTVTGTNRHGDTITESIAGPNIGSVNGGKNFKAVTDVAVDAATAGAITVGTNDSADSRWWPTNMHKTPFNVGMCARLVNSGALSYKIQHTGEDLQDTTGATGIPEDDVTPFDHPDFGTPKTANFDANYAAGIKGIRLEVTGHTAGGIVLDINQAGW